MNAPATLGLSTRKNLYIVINFLTDHCTLLGNTNILSIVLIIVDLYVQLLHLLDLLIYGSIEHTFHQFVSYQIHWSALSNKSKSYIRKEIVLSCCCCSCVRGDRTGLVQEYDYRGTPPGF